MDCAGNNVARFVGLIFGIVRDTMGKTRFTQRHSVLADVFLDLSQAIIR